MTSFESVAHVDAGTKRAEFASGKRSKPTTNLTGLRVTEFFPISPEIQARLGTDAPQALLEAFIEGDYDIVRGDILAIGSVDYPIYALEKWPFAGTYRYRILVEDLLF